MKASRRRTTLRVMNARWLAGGLLLALVAPLWVFPLQEPDEGRYADIAAEMLRGGDWITPHEDGIRSFEKPPLSFWLAAASMAVFGQNELGARLPSALASFLTILLVVHWASRALGRRVGLVSGAVLVSIPLFAVLARGAMVDPALCLFTTCALYAAYRGVVEPEQPQRRWILLLWASLALASLVKGPVGIVLPLGSVLLHLAILKEWRKIGGLLRPDGPALLLLIASPWYVAMSVRNPDYAREFFLSENLGRLVTGAHFYRNRGIWYYLPVFLLGFLPWPLLLAPVVRTLREPQERTPLRAYLAVAFAFPFLILSVAHSKLPHYLLPLAPPFAILVADVLCSQWDAKPDFGRAHLAWFFAVMVAVGLAAIGVSLMTPEALVRLLRWAPDSSNRELDRFRILGVQSALAWSVPLAILLGAAGLGARALIGRARPVEGAIVIAGAAIVIGGLAPLPAGRMGPLFSAKEVARAIQRHGGGQSGVISFCHLPLRGLPFYLRRPVVLEQALYDEFGHDLTPGDVEGYALQKDPARLRRIVDGPTRHLLLADQPERVDELQQQCGHEVAELERVGPYRILSVKH